MRQTGRWTDSKLILIYWSRAKTKQGNENEDILADQFKFSSRCMNRGHLNTYPAKMEGGSNLIRMKKKSTKTSKTASKGVSNFGCLIWENISLSDDSILRQLEGDKCKCKDDFIYQTMKLVCDWHSKSMAIVPETRRCRSSRLNKWSRIKPLFARVSILTEVRTFKVFKKIPLLSAHFLSTLTTKTIRHFAGLILF